MPGFVRNLGAAVLASGLACATSCWAQQASNTNLPLVWVLSTGGTIAGAGASPTNVQEYKGGTILGEDLVEAVPEIKQFANVKVQQITNVGSPRLKLENLLTLANGINVIFCKRPERCRGRGPRYEHTGGDCLFSKSHCKVRPPCDCGRLDASFHCYQCGRTAKPPKRNSNGDIVGSQGKRCTRSDE